MAVALRGAAVLSVLNATTTFTLVIDSNVVTDDLIFITITNRGGTTIGTMTVTDNDSGGNTWTRIGGTSDDKASIWMKRATSGSASKTVTVASAIAACLGVMKAFSGASTGVTPYADLIFEVNVSGNEIQTGVTPTNADSMLCAAVFNHTEQPAVSNLAFATLGATTFSQREGTASGQPCAVAYGHVAQVGGPTATGDLTWSQGNFATHSAIWSIVPTVGGRTTKNTRAWPLGMEVGMNWRGNI